MEKEDIFRNKYIEGSGVQGCKRLSDAAVIKGSVPGDLSW